MVFDRLTTQQTAALTLPFQDIFTIKLRDLMTSRDDLNRSPVGMRRVNRCAAFQAGCLDVGTAFHEQLHDFRSSEKRGGVQRSSSITICTLQIRAILNQNLRRFGMSMKRCPGKRSNTRRWFLRVYVSAPGQFGRNCIQIVVSNCGEQGR